MRVLIDALVAQSQPALAEAALTRVTDIGVTVFDPFAPPTQIAAAFSATVPDMILVDPAWLVVSSLLLTVVQMSGCTETRCVVGSPRMDNVLKIQAAHGGFFDVVDLTADPHDVLDHLESNCRGISRLDTDRIWTTVPRPSSSASLFTIPKDPGDLAILELIRIGLSDAEISRSIHMSQQTVRNRVSAMLRRSGLTNRTQMAWTFTNQVLIMRMIQGMDAHG